MMVKIKEPFKEPRISKKANLTKEHAERYSISKEDVKRIQKIIAKIPAKKRPNIKATETGYSMTFIYPIYSAKINEET